MSGLSRSRGIATVRAERSALSRHLLLPAQAVIHNETISGLMLLITAMALKREGKALSTQAGEFVREEIHHIREGKHGARSAKQAIAIGLSKARQAGVHLKPRRKGRTSEATRRSAERAYKKGLKSRSQQSIPRRSKAALDALKRESGQAASSTALSRQARRAKPTPRIG